MYGNANLTGIERKFDADDIIVTKTDISGKIIYGNRTFYKMTGCTESEALGKQHNLVRHPEMPRAIFKLLWDTLQNGEEIFAYVNNRALNGDNYWVLAHVTPSFDSSQNIIGYHSNRRKPNRKLIDERIVPLYRDLLAVEKTATSPKEGMQQAVDHIHKLLDDHKMSFNKFIFSLGV